MGRMLDTLRHADPHRAVRAPGPTRPASDVQPEECVVDWTLQEEVPFIEVGGPGKSVELSASLVKHPAQAKVQPPHPPLGKGFVPTRSADAVNAAEVVVSAARATPIVNLTDAHPMTVAFEVWPGPSGPAVVAADVIVHHHPEHPVSKEYAALYEKMVHGLPGAGPHVLMFCGLKPRVGASTVLLNLAVVAAGLGRRVAALDMNLARPGLAVRLGQTSPGGVREVIGGSLAPSQALLPTAIAALHILPAGGSGKQAVPLSPAAIVWLTCWLRERYDAILIDGPCVEEAVDLAVLAPCADGIYLVLPQSDPDVVGKGVAQSIARMGGRMRGLIHTRFDV
jgi:Mrp family chromosome partitioning ATPase